MEKCFCVFYLLILTLQNTLSEPCGPNNNCTCSKTIGQTSVVHMDCANKRLELKKICEYIASCNCRNYKEIVASDNMISTLDKASLKGCEGITVLDLSNNILEELAEDAFAELNFLSLLDLSGNRLSSIYNSSGQTFLRNIPSLMTLYLHGNYNSSHGWRHSYPKFVNLQNLSTLKMDGLYDTAFGQYYRNLPSFKRLSLSGESGQCNQTHLRNNTFENTPRLQELLLANCNLVSIDSGTFIPLTQLKNLDLSGNSQLGFRTLRNISYGLQFTNIDFLNYSAVHHHLGLGTFITKRDICYFRNTTLRVLSLNNNRLQMLEKNAAILMPTTFQELHVEGNEFDIGIYLSQGACFANATKLFANGQNRMKLQIQINDPFPYVDPIANVTIPSIDDCPFMTDSYLKNISSPIDKCNFIENNTFNLWGFAFPKNLTVLEFSDCNIHLEIPSLNISNTLEYLDFSKNVLYSWKGNLLVPALRTLNLSQNYCSNVSYNFFDPFRSLENLDLSENFLGLVLASNSGYEIFQNLSNLTTLNLAGNKIQSLPPDIFQNLSRLRCLNLSFNSLTHFHVRLEKLENLAVLDISQNGISTLPIKLFNHFKELSQRKNVSISINLKGNPLRCTCENKFFIQLMFQNPEYFKSLKNYCFVNDKEQDMSFLKCKKVSNAFGKECRTPTEYTIAYAVGGSSLLLLLVILITGIMYRKRWKLRYFMYMHKKRFYGYRRLPDEEPLEIYKYDAFISYSEDNIGFILKEIIPNLEKTDRGMSLCIHQRDFLPGNAIADNIIEAIQSSKKTVVLLSNSFLKRKWCLYEFHMARMETMYSREGRGCLIVVMLEPVSTKHMPMEMIQWIKNESYIEFTKDEEGYVLFWNKLKDSITCRGQC